MARVTRVRHVCVLFAFVAASCGGTSGSGLGSHGGSGSGGSSGSSSGVAGDDASAGQGSLSDDASFGDGRSCSGTDPVEGCACAQPGQSAACWTGPASDRHVGVCMDGTSQCVQHGEFSVWGPCQGEVLDCGDASMPEANAPPPPAPDGGCAAPDQMGRCPPGTIASGFNPPPCFPFCDGGISIPALMCCPCTASDCDATKQGGAGCCLSEVCAGAAACSTCSTSQLDPACNGRVDPDCDDFPEECDQLCCPCKPAGACQACGPGQIPCNGVCVDGVSDPAHCGACDHTCGGGQNCVSGNCQ